MGRVNPQPTPGTALSHDAEAVAALARSARERLVGSPVLVGIDGPSGSGKTSLAALVARLLGDPPVVHMDDLYPGWDGLAAALPVLHDQILLPLAQGAPASYRRYDWVTQAYAEWRRVRPDAPYVLVEGAGATVGDAACCYAVRVWLEAPTPVRRRRGIERDGEAYQANWERWADQEQQVLDVPVTRRAAHLLITTG